jgi:hypothetical protein
VIGVVGLLVAGVAVAADQPSGTPKRLLVTSGHDTDTGADAGADAGAPSPTAVPSTTAIPSTTDAPSATIPRTAATTTTIASRPPAGTAPSPGAGAASSSAASVSFVNEYPQAVSVNVNGVATVLGPGQTVGPVAITPAPSGNDTVEIGLVDVPTCGVGDAMGYFEAGRRYRFTVRAGRSPCTVAPDSFPGPDFAVSPA